MFRVLLEPPAAGTFIAGSTVHGRVEVVTEEAKRFRYIHVSITGRAQVGWTDNSTYKEYRAEKEYIHETKMLWTKDEEKDSVFPAGNHMFPFQFQLSPHIPSSFEGRVGSVRYKILGRVVTEIIRGDHWVNIEIPVMQVVNVNEKPHLIVPQSLQARKKVWNFPCTFTDVWITVSLSRTGFCLGEEIPLNVHLENFSRNEVTISAILQQMITYMAKKGRRERERAIVVRVKSHPFSAHTATVWPANLSIPRTEATSQDFDLINIEYRVKVVAEVAWGQKLVAKIPVTIGNIPFWDSLADGTSCNVFPQTTQSSTLDDHPLDPQLEHTKLLPAGSNESLSEDKVSMTTQSCGYNSECVYSVQELVDPCDL